MTPPRPTLADVLARLDGIDRDAAAAAHTRAVERWATRAKPPGSLGRIEALGATLARVQGTCPPRIPVRPAVIVFAGDHGAVADGASAWPSEVTGAMVRTMAAGSAAINAFATTVGATIEIVDVGVATPLDDVEGVVQARVHPGTASIATGPAMTRDQATAAVEVGIARADAAIGAGADLLVGGEMGIGNTAPSTAIVAHVTGRDPATLVGAGAGAPPDGLGAKTAVVTAAVDRIARRSERPDAIDVLAELGGYEIGALVGLQLAGLAHRVPVVVDGVIATAAALLTGALVPDLATFLVAGHRSTEPAASAALAHLRLDPVLDLDLRLGEGTGACLAVPVVQAAARALRDMADLPAPG